MAKTFQDLLNEGQAKVLGIVSIVPMDDWNADTQYQKLNLVRHNGATYLAKGGNKNVEPGAAADWQNSWMLVYLDGILSPDGTYPNLTAGRVMHALAWGNKNYDGSSAQTITAADLGLADVYKPQGSIAYSALPATPSASNYGYVWNITNDFTTDSRFIEGAGKEYSAGTNVGVIEQNGAYYYDILGNFVDFSDYAKIDGNYQEMTVGQATNAQNTANVTSQINGHAISDIFESDGTTVKNASEAEILTDGLSVGNSASSTIQGYYQFLTAPQLDNYQQTNIRLEFTDTNIANYPESICGIELRYYHSPTAPNRVDVYVLYGNPDILNNVWVSVTANNGIALYFYNRGAYSSIHVKAFYQGKRSLTNADNFNIFENTTSYIAELPADNTNTALPDLEHYSLITQAESAINDGDGNQISTTYAKQNGTYRNFIAGGVDNVSIGSTTNINNYYGADYWGKEYYFSGGNNPQGSPEGISGGHLSVIRAGNSTTIQVIRTGVGSDFSGLPTTYQRDWNGSVWTAWEEIVTSDGSYKTLGAGRVVAAGRLGAGSDVNNCIPEEYEALYVWSCWSTAAVPGILNLPAGLTGTFYLTAYKTWEGDTADKYRLIQTIYECAGNRGIYQRSEDNSSGDGNITSPWQQLVYADGSYLTLGAGYLAKRLQISNGTLIGKYYKVASFTAANDSENYSFILLVNGIYGGQNTSYAAKSGIIEFETRSNNGVIASGNTNISILAGNLVPTDFFVIESDDGKKAELWVYVYQQYGGMVFVELSARQSSTNNLVFDGTRYDAAPANAVYAVNRNYAAKGVTPATSSDSDDVATTEWVNNKGYITPTGSQTITGDKTFTGDTSISNLTNSNNYRGLFYTTFIARFGNGSGYLTQGSAPKNAMFYICIPSTSNDGPFLARGNASILYTESNYNGTVTCYAICY